MTLPFGTMIIFMERNSKFMEKIFIDTSGWVALFVGNDKNHKKASDILGRLQSAKALMYTSDYCIDETVTTILMRGSHHQSVTAGEALFTSKLIKIVYIAPDYLQKTWLLYKKYHDKKFSFTDVSSFVVMKELMIPKALSFDRHFLQAGIEVLE